MRFQRSHVGVMGLSLALLASVPARAQEVGTTVILFEPSIEAAGMGGGGVAYFWRDEPNSWSNPALLGTQPGLRYSHGSTQILEEFADDVYLKSNRFSLGYGGIGVLFAGKPIEGLGEDMKLDYGESEATDIDGNVIATFSAYEEARSIGVGVSILDLLGTVLGPESGIHDVRRRLGISVGHTWKDIVFETDPELPGIISQGKAEQKDRGAAIRVTPLDEIGDALDEPSERLRWKIDLAAGFAQLNYDDDGDFSFDDTSIPSEDVFELQRAGGAARFTLAFPSTLQGSINNFITPTVRLGLSYERSDYYGDGGEAFEFDNERVGAELALADALYLRWGHVQEGIFAVDHSTWGAGLAVRYKGIAGVRFDYAHYPFSQFLENEFVERFGITVLLDVAGVLLDKPTFGEKFKM
jgi:hypothetical protein